MTGVRVPSPSFPDWPPIGPLVRTELFSSRHGLAEKWQLLGDLRPPPAVLGLLLSDHLVTMGVPIKPWGATMV